MAPRALQGCVCGRESMGWLANGGEPRPGSRGLGEALGVCSPPVQFGQRTLLLTAQGTCGCAERVKPRRTSLISEGCLDRLPVGANLCLRLLR